MFFGLVFEIFKISISMADGDCLRMRPSDFSHELTRSPLNHGFTLDMTGAQIEPYNPIAPW